MIFIAENSTILTNQKPLSAWYSEYHNTYKGLPLKKNTITIKEGNMNTISQSKSQEFVDTDSKNEGASTYKKINRSPTKTRIISENTFGKKIRVDQIQNAIIHGDALTVLKKLPSKCINLIVTSPSYEVGKEYEKEQTFDEYLEEQDKIIEECKRVLKDDGSIYWNVAQTPKDGEIIPLGAIFYQKFKRLNFFLKNWIIWRFEGGLNCKNRLSGRYENILWFVKNKEKFIFNLDEIRIPSKWYKDKRNHPKGKNPTDFWTFTTDSIWEINRVVNVSKEKTIHPCQFPERMIERIIKASSNEGHLVLDMFNGSGTTCKVAKDLNRKYIGVDKELKYCKVAKKRTDNEI